MALSGHCRYILGGKESEPVSVPSVPKSTTLLSESDMICSRMLYVEVLAAFQVGSGLARVRFRDIL